MRPCPQQAQTRPLAPAPSGSDSAWWRRPDTSAWRLSGLITTTTQKDPVSCRLSICLAHCKIVLSAAEQNTTPGTPCMAMRACGKAPVVPASAPGEHLAQSREGAEPTSPRLRCCLWRARHSGPRLSLLARAADLVGLPDPQTCQVVTPSNIWSRLEATSKLLWEHATCGRTCSSAM